MNWVIGVSIAAMAAALLWAFRLRARVRHVHSEHRSDSGRLQGELRDLRSELAMFREAFERSQLGILLVDPEGSVVAANLAAQEFVGARHGAAIAEAKIVELLGDARRSPQAREAEVEMHNPVPRTLRVRAEPIGGAGWSAVYVTDVTDRKKVDAARTDFVANVSHELKTPLGALAVLAETLEATDDPEVRRRLIGRVGEQAARLTRLVDDILDLSLVEAAGFEPAIVDLDKVLAAAAANVRDAATAAGVSLEVVGAPGGVRVRGDERQLISALGNLISNAVSYTAIAAPPRAVTSRALIEDGRAVLEVADTGIGIPKTHQERIFERFYRVDSARGGATGGTGLGLAIVRHVALNHGGRVDVKSESGVGSTFRIVLPAEEESR